MSHKERPAYLKAVAAEGQPKLYRTWEVKPREGEETKYSSPWYVMEKNPKKSRKGYASARGFASEEEARIYAAMKTDEDMARELVKAERRAVKAAERKAVPNPFKVGMIFENSWGYEQTNVDYYEVVRVTPRGVYVRPIGCKSVVNSGLSHGMADSVVPDKGNFTGPEQFKTVRPGSEKGYLSAEFGCMKLVQEWEATYRSWYA